MAEQGTMTARGMERTRWPYSLRADTTDLAGLWLHSLTSCSVKVPTSTKARRWSLVAAARLAAATTAEAAARRAATADLETPTRAHMACWG